jgi:hypothetical protein
MNQTFYKALTYGCPSLHIGAAVKKKAPRSEFKIQNAGPEGIRFAREFCKPLVIAIASYQL